MFRDNPVIQNFGKEKNMTEPNETPVEEVPETAEAFDETDVSEALKRDTDDGKGGAVVPSGDFDSYQAGENVTGYDPEADS
jgi:hypothetical protein